MRSRVGPIGCPLSTPIATIRGRVQCQSATSNPLLHPDLTRCGRNLRKWLPFVVRLSSEPGATSMRTVFSANNMPWQNLRGLPGERRFPITTKAALSMHNWFVSNLAIIRSHISNRGATCFESFPCGGQNASWPGKSDALDSLHYACPSSTL